MKCSTGLPVLVSKTCPVAGHLPRVLHSRDYLPITIHSYLQCRSEKAYMTHIALNSLSTLDSIFQLHTTNSVTSTLKLSNQMDMIRQACCVCISPYQHFYYFSSISFVLFCADCKRSTIICVWKMSKNWQTKMIGYMDIDKVQS